MKESDILYQRGDFWVVRHPKGWLEVYQTGVTHSVKRGTIDFRADPAKQFQRAKAECDRRHEAAG